MILSLAALAAPVNPFREADESDLYRLDEQLVTVASRYEQTVRKAPSIVTVITAEEIRSRGFRTVSEALRSLPGIYLWTSPEGRDLAAIRGVISPDNNKVLVLVDGVPFYDGLYQHGLIGEPLPISALKQIEVIKGPGSAIYGTNAFTGVVNLVTWSAEDLQGGKARLMGSTGNRWDLTLNAGGTKQVGQTNVSVEGFVRLFLKEGFSVDFTPDGDRNIGGDDPRRGINLGGRVHIGGLRVQAHHQGFRHRFRQQSSFVEVQDALANDLDSFGLGYNNTTLDVRYLGDLGPAVLTPFFTVQWYDNPGSYFFGTSVVETEKRTMRWVVGVDSELRPGVDHRLVAGAGLENIVAQSVADVRYDDGAPGVLHDAFAVYDSCGAPAGWKELGLDVGLDPETTRCRTPTLRTFYAYAQYTWTVGPSIELTAGARLDNRFPPANSAPPADLGLGGQLRDARFFSVSPRAGVLLVPSENVTAKVLYGRAFRAPTVRELLVASDYNGEEYTSTTANFALRPETIDTAEVEVTADLGKMLSVRGDVNASLLDSEIDKVDPGLYCNLPGQLAVLGAEAEVRGRFGFVEADLAYALAFARYGGNEPDDNCQDGDRNDFANGENPYKGRGQYEYPEHMFKARLGLNLSDDFQINALGELYGPRERTQWYLPDAPEALPTRDGPAFPLLHIAGRIRNLGPKGRFGVDVAVRNVLDSRAATAQYRDDASEITLRADGPPVPAFQVGYPVERRSMTIGVDFQL